eukprot:gnl/TRDRNA2_/TRDRNA2_167079_c0_seq2.p1 gnl/TRDRNA2_/TRDRNA2_167079_c0~~gnl/TRDRNA2_/TRDRNA2_167079_c0_seq2.p1  ORF type:complete len:188 (+),score=12.84 gnl/TRDRNA2_/TRDRNA2_167079_c0_seq2:219-782(+)
MGPGQEGRLLRTCPAPQSCEEHGLLRSQHSSTEHSSNDQAVGGNSLGIVMSPLHMALVHFCLRMQHSSSLHAPPRQITDAASGFNAWVSVQMLPAQNPATSQPLCNAPDDGLRFSIQCSGQIERVHTTVASRSIFPQSAKVMVVVASVVELLVVLRSVVLMLDVGGSVLAMEVQTVEAAVVRSHTAP